MKSLPILYIVVPCYNEEEALPLSAPVFRKKLGDLIDAGAIAPESRIVLVDDGSKDATWSIIRSLHESDAHFTGLRQICNRGHQNALTAGLMWSRTRCDITISIDADLQDDIDAMDKMVEKYKEGCGIVCGVRASRATDTFLKRTTARGYYGLMKLFGLPARVERMRPGRTALELRMGLRRHVIRVKIVIEFDEFHKFSIR